MSNGNYSRRRKRSNPLTGILFFLIAAGIFLLLSTTVFFNVETIKVTGASNYTTEEIIAASQIKAGDNLVRLNTAKSAESIEKELVYIETASLSRSFPNTLVINVEASVPTANFITNTYTLLLSDGGKILDKLDEPKAGLFNFIGTTPRVDLGPGDMYTSTDEHKDDAVLKLMDYLSEHSDENITEVNVTDRSDLICVFDNRITVKLGSINDLEYKINFAKEIITTKIGDKTEGTLTILSDSDSASFLDKESIENNEKIYADNLAQQTAITDENGEIITEITDENSENSASTIVME